MSAAPCPTEVLHLAPQRPFRELGVIHATARLEPFAYLPEKKDYESLERKLRHGGCEVGADAIVVDQDVYDQRLFVLFGRAVAISYSPTP